jgi:hypothetical protein
MNSREEIENILSWILAVFAGILTGWLWTGLF